MKPFNLKEYIANSSRKVVTRDGRNVRIVCTDAKQPNPIIALVELPSHYESVILYSKKGEFWTNGTPHPNDLFFADEKHEGWINIYVDSEFENDVFTGAHVYKLKEDAEKVGKNNQSYITTIKIEWKK